MLQFGLTGIFIVLMFAASTLADDATKSPLTIVSELHTLHVTDQSGQPKVIRKLVVLLINNGAQPLTVVTDHLDQSKDDGDGTAITLGLNGTAKKDGHLIIPSLSKLAPVTLQPGEAAAISTDQVNLTDFESGKLKIGYAVSEAWGKRLSLWAGTVASETKMK